MSTFPARLRLQSSLKVCAAVSLIASAPIAFVISNSDASSMSPATLMNLALANAIGSHWVHEVGTVQAPSEKAKVVNDIGTASGRQVIDVNGAHAEVIVINKVAYIKGNAKAVVNYFQLTKTDPGKYDNKWLSIPSSSTGYANVSQSVTLKSDFDTWKIPGKLHEEKVTTVNGESVIPISGQVTMSVSSPTVSVTLYVTATGKTLPVEVVLKSSSETEIVKWSKWGKSVSIEVPAKFTPIAKA